MVAVVRQDMAELNVVVISSESWTRSDCLPVASCHHFLGTYTICGSLLSTCFIYLFIYLVFFLSFFFFNQTDLSGCLGFLQSCQSQDFIRQHQILVCVMYSQLFGSSLQHGTSGSLQLLLFGSSVLGSPQAPTLVTHGCLCLMGFYCLENAKERVIANLFHAWVSACISQQLPAKQALFAASLRRKAPIETNKGSFSFCWWTQIQYLGQQKSTSRVCMFVL